jgi:hypothetical protein
VNFDEDMNQAIVPAMADFTYSVPAFGNLTPVVPPVWQTSKQLRLSIPYGGPFVPGEELSYAASVVRMTAQSGAVVPDFEYMPAVAG